MRDKLWLAHWLGGLLTGLFEVAFFGCAIAAAVFFEAAHPDIDLLSDLPLPLYVAGFGAAYFFIRAIVTKRRADRAESLWDKYDEDDDPR